MSLCDRCGKPIAGNAADPICCTSLGTHHYACMQAAWRDHHQAQIARQEAGRARRSAAAKARWAKEGPPAAEEEDPRLT